MNCCQKCFVDEVVIRHIKQNGKTGFCDYCEKRRQKVVEANSLLDLFYPVVSLFIPANIGDESSQPMGMSLPNCMEKETGWNIFSPDFDYPTKALLLDDIRCVENCQDSRKFENKPESIESGGKWLPPQSLLKHAKGEYVWAEFANTIKWKRRFLPDNYIGSLNNPKTWLPELLKDFVRPVTPRDTYFRARIGGEEEELEVRRPFPAAKMGAPSVKDAAPNRANPRGISYLYAAESEYTAVSEIRPYTGMIISVARLNPKVELRLVDLTNVPTLKSPFGVKYLKQELEKHAILSILNRELSKPINKELPDIEYAPTQYLAEVILEAGYDGIRYRSAMHDQGQNVVFFNAKNMSIQPVTTLVRLNSMRVEFSKVRESIED